MKTCLIRETISSKTMSRLISSALIHRRRRDTLSTLVEAAMSKASGKKTGDSITSTNWIRLSINGGLVSRFQFFLRRKQLETRTSSSSMSAGITSNAIWRKFLIFHSSWTLRSSRSFRGQLETLTSSSAPWRSSRVGKSQINSKKAWVSGRSSMTAHSLKSSTRCAETSRPLPVSSRRRYGRWSSRSPGSCR